MIWIGLDYASCKAMLEAHDFPPHVLTDFPAIEDAVLPIFNESDQSDHVEDEDA